MADITVTLDTRELDRLAEGLNLSLEDVMVSLAFDIESGAKLRAPVDTSAMKNSIYTRTKKQDGYSKAASSAKSAREGVVIDHLPAPEGDIIATVGPCVNYAEYVEYGTSRASAQPFLTPAVEEVSRKLEDGTTYKKLFGEGAE